MILLGSIDRLELLALCDWWLSPERRLLMLVRTSSCSSLAVYILLLQGPHTVSSRKIIKQLMKRHNNQRN